MEPNEPAGPTGPETPGGYVAWSDRPAERPAAPPPPPNAATFGGGPIPPPFSGSPSAPAAPPRSRRGLWTCLAVLCFLGALGVVGVLVIGSLASSLGLSDSPERVSGGFLGGGKVGLVRVENMIVDAARTLDVIRYYAETDSIKAVLVRIDSPGGAVGASQEIYQALMDLKTKHHKPVVVSMGNVAASGGYYIACAGSEIYTNPGTLTGSIGVIMSLPNLEKVADKVGFTEVVLKSGRFKDAGSMVRPMTPEERNLLQGVIDDTYKQFSDAVYESRREALTASLEKIRQDPKAREVGILGPDVLPVDGLDARSLLDRVADGRVLTGRQAQVLGLVDALGTQQDALRALGQRAGIARPALVEYKPKRPLSDLLGSSAESALRLTGLPLQGARLEYRLAF